MTKGVLFQAGPQNYLFHLAPVGTFWVRHGSEIIADVLPAADARFVETVLLGPVLTAAVLQRGALALRASAVVGARGAIVIAGAGKSTVLAELVRRGCPMLSDDLTSIASIDGDLVVQPGAPIINLWKGAADRLGWPTDDAQRVRAQIDRFRIPMDEHFCASAQPLRSIYFFGEGSGVMTALSGMAAIKAIRTHCCSWRTLEGLQMQEAHFRLATAIALRVKLKHLPRLEKDNFADVTRLIATECQDG